jgi:hypothetical protein
MGGRSIGGAIIESCGALLMDAQAASRAARKTVNINFLE